jgi:hypothetical protein
MKNLFAKKRLNANFGVEKWEKKMQDKWSRMYGKELCVEIRKITMSCNNGKGLSIPQSWQFADEWAERQMREFLRFLYANLKEAYINGVLIMDGMDKEQEKEGKI